MFRFTIMLCLFAAALGSSAREAGTPPMIWDESANRVTVSIEDWKLDRLMKELVKISRWEVMVEPGTDIIVSAKFQNQTTREALSRLLKDVNYAVVREPGHKPKLLIFRTSAKNATQMVKGVSEEEAALEAARMPNELIVSLKPGASIDSLAARYGAKVIAAIPELGLYRLRFEDDAKADFAKSQLANFPEVNGVEYNYTVARPDTPVIAGTGTALPFSLNPTAATGGNGVVIGLIDTAVQPLNGKMNDFLLKAISAAGNSDAEATSLLHGTSMAETILRALSMTSDGGNSTTKILPVDVFGGRETTSTFDLANGIYLAVKNGATIINMSLGSPATATYLETLIANSAAQGVLFLGAAGNEPTSSPTYPAAYSPVIAVTAGNRNGEIASYANYGAFVDVVAPGTSLVVFNGKTYMVGGTSAATATSTGVAAQLKASSNATADQIRQKLSQIWPKNN